MPASPPLHPSPGVAAVPYRRASGLRTALAADFSHHYTRAANRGSHSTRLHSSRRRHEREKQRRNTSWVSRHCGKYAVRCAKGPCLRPGREPAYAAVLEAYMKMARMRPYRPSTSAKMRMRIMEMNILGCSTVKRTPLSPTMPMA
ncbi:hypothetical protein ONE63_002284 [Megalurothrips usitatus]|uniref:Uncharacterized protein n=1 Tax=Megalurothrips usitatus TaxID=439358 RepID=A0AAV7X7Q1_9NEOP|nr:hypothetical protein ONE63_002284 [Megalurothrips usitatus]